MIQNKYIEPLVSLVIIGAIFCVALFVILNREQAFNKQLQASVIQSVAKSDSEEQIVDNKTKRCLEEAYNTFLSQWNQECQGLNLEEKCSLLKEIAEPLKEEYQGLEETCYTK